MELGVEMAVQRIHAIVYGKVQGVYFRAYTQAEGNRLGLKGWVKNRADGAVEVVVEGEPEKVAEMLAWLKQGSPGSQVARVETKEERPVGEPQFNIRY
jgi:acylphosphatase